MENRGHMATGELNLNHISRASAEGARVHILVTGANGQLGSDVLAALQAHSISCVGADIAEFDITDAEGTMCFLKNEMPTAVIHCAAYTAVDKAEEEPEQCERINILGTENVAQACRTTGASMLYISTDYVFPGEGEAFYETTDPTGPKNVYGTTKRMGEQAVLRILDRSFIVRTSWVFGKKGPNFVQTILRIGKENAQIRVVGDQYGSPTYTKDLSELLCQMALSDRFGIYHATNQGVCSWADFARAIVDMTGLPCTINEVLSEDYPARASRPKNSRLSPKSLLENDFCLLPHWTDALKRYWEEIQLDQ